MSALRAKAAATAQQHLAAELPRRWRHVQAVAAKADRLGGLVGEDAEFLTAAAWLHDIGYAVDIRDTGFHALDGARWLLTVGFSARLAALVAHHSCASYEAAERGLGHVLAAEFSLEMSPVSDTLWFVDMTTGPDGQDMTVGERLAEIRERYGRTDLVTRFWIKGELPLLDAVQRTQERIALHPM
ncbi:HDIG domain-containing metalloprotein [Micromonospora sp. NPDC005324]|uniref:HDIG domain-containing metalloprotein n=1 Tax=Micromonospora sp. NPDC005324 TaxID=3157033 RepID=UPI0033BE6BCB